MRANLQLRALMVVIATVGVAMVLSVGLAAAQATLLPVHLAFVSRITAGISLQTGVVAGIQLRVLAIASVVGALSSCAAVAQATPLPEQLALAGRIAAGLSYPVGVAVDNDPHSSEYGDAYVVDNGHYRVQVLSSTGAFVEMFGGEVDATTKGDTCTAVSKDTCQPGTKSSVVGQFSEPYSIAIDPSSGDVYVAEYVHTEAGLGPRVQAFTDEGAFLYEIGKEVNITKDKEGAPEAEKNLCSEMEIEKGVECGGPAQDVPGSEEDGSFNFETYRGNLLAVGGEGTNDILYVGDEHRVQEFEAVSGKWVRDISLTEISNAPESKVQALAFDPESGDIYLNYPNGNLVREFDPEGNPLPSMVTVAPLHEGKEVLLRSMAFDGSGRLAVMMSEEGSGQPFGSLYDAEDGRRVSGIAIPSGVTFVLGIGFSDAGALYAAIEEPAFIQDQEILAYKADPIGELTIGSSGCIPGAEHESSATFECTLNGEANPEGVSGTEALFEWGRTPNLGEETLNQPVAAAGPVHTVVSLRPNETFYYRLAGFDQNVKPPEEAFSSEEASLATETVAPKIFGTTTSVVRPSSAVLLGELSPENAPSKYYFEYEAAPGTLAGCTAGSKDCPGVATTQTFESAVYGRIGAVAEISGLQPGTVYRYRLFVENESRINSGEKFSVTSAEGSFETAPAPQPSAQTGGYSGVTFTSATIFGTVDPDGLGAGYAFELGVYNGAQTQYTSVFSGSAGAGSEPVAESYALTGLQPGTTYVYRISVSSGYILNESHTLQGAPVVFTTAGAATVLVAPPSLPILATPAVPAEHITTPPPEKKCKRDYARNKHGVCVKQKAKKKARKGRKGRRSGAHKTA